MTSLVVVVVAAVSVLVVEVTLSVPGLVAVMELLSLQVVSRPVVEIVAVEMDVMVVEIVENVGM